MNWKFKEDAVPQCSSEFWYDMTDGGYIKPASLLADEDQLKALNDAVGLIQSFRESAEQAGLIEQM